MTVTGITGTIYALEPTPLGSGGEGDVYSVIGMDKVAKIYRPNVLTDELAKKLVVMLDNPPSETALSQVAWPVDLLDDANGNCCGFIMLRLSINTELGDIYKYPSTIPISSHQKINIAQNICVVISEVHKSGYVFGDFNPRNIGLDIETGLVSFLDTDTYHVVDMAKDRVYRCNVCAPGYAAPELLEKCSDYVASNPTASKNAYAQTSLPTFTKETDNFALAIHIFKLLMNGYTPFGGIIETASVSQSSPGIGDSAVRRDSYCFKPGYKHQSAAIMPLEALPQEMADMFTRAFILGKIDPRQRPDAVEWHGALERYEQSLVTCSNNPLHQYDRKNNVCPLCEADRLYAEAVGGSVPSEPSLKQSTYTKPPVPVQKPTTKTKVKIATKIKNMTSKAKIATATVAAALLIISVGVVVADKMTDKPVTDTSVSDTSVSDTSISSRTELEAIIHNLYGKYHLVADIDLSDADWRPINGFSGVFDGQGYVIRNMSITGDIEDAGLFGFTSDAVIENVGIEDAKINISGYDVYAGGLVGYAQYTHISNCYNTGSIYASNTTIGGAYVGGLVGFTEDSHISNCYNTGSIYASYPGGASYSVSVGGIVGSSYTDETTIIDCYNTGSISAHAGRVYGQGQASYAFAGGICGNGIEELQINNSFNSGSVSATNSYSSDYSFIGDICGAWSEQYKLFLNSLFP